MLNRMCGNNRADSEDMARLSLRTKANEFINLNKAYAYFIRNR